MKGKKKRYTEGILSLSEGEEEEEEEVFKYNERSVLPAPIKINLLDEDTPALLRPPPPPKTIWRITYSAVRSPYPFCWTGNDWKEREEERVAETNLRPRFRFFLYYFLNSFLESYVDK